MTPTSAASPAATPIGQPIEPPIRIGPWELVPGVKRRHFFSLLGASYFTIGLMTLVGNLQPYLFNAVLNVPGERQGTLSGNLAFYNELVFISLVSFLGAASDKLGRRPIYAFGFLVMAVAYTLYPLARDPGELLLYRLIFAVGAASVSAMLAAIIADYPLERSRGKLVGICFFLNGIGVASLVVLGGKLPQIVQSLGADPVQAGRCAYWAVAAMCFVPLVIVAFGLKPGAPAQLGKREPLLTTFLVGVRAARDPRVLLAYLSAMVSRGDLAIISTFFLLWMTQAGMAEGMSPADAQAKGVVFFGITQVVATLWAVCVIFFIDRFDRVLALAGAMVLAAASYISIGLIEHPFQGKMYFAAAFLGIGEMSGILASQSLVGQVAGERGRGAIIGMFSLFGAIGILAATKFGGMLFDTWRPSAPYLVVGIADAVLAVLALGVYFGTRTRGHALASAA
jgi:MFS family permease